MKKIITYLGCFLFCAISYAQTEITQKMAAVDSVSITRGNNVIEKVFGVESKGRTCLVFSIHDKVLLIYKSCGVYKLHTFIEKFNFDIQENELQEKKTRKVKKDKILDRVFNTTICEKQFTYSSTDSLTQKYAHWDSRYIYFVAYKNGTKTCEFNLPMTFKVDVGDKKFIPIEQDIFNYLVEKLVKMTK